MDGFRDKIIAIFDKSLGDDLFPTPNDRLYCAFLIEKGLFERFQETSKLYKDKYRDIAFALKDTRNSDLNQKLASGEIPPEAVAHLTAEQMASENQLKELHAKKMEMRDARRSDWQAEHGQFTDMFKCGRCKQHKCTYTQLQTRGADEPMTTFVNCANCGNRWKF